MALIYFYDATDLDREQLDAGLQATDHQWQFVEGEISLDNLHPDTEVISVFVSSSVTREMIEKLPRLRLIACRSTGFNNIDLAAAAQRDIAVVNVPTYGEVTVAEYSFALLLSLTRKLRYVLTERDMQPDDQSRGRDIADKVMGVIGTGHIGLHVAKIAKGFGMEVIAYDPFPKPDQAEEIGFRYAELDEVLAHADVVSLHVPYMPATHHLMNRERLGMMKKGAYLLNTARGELVDTKALIDVLQDGLLGGAALDVLEGEHLLQLDEEVALLRGSASSPNMLEHSVEIMALQHMPNVIVTPHNAFNTVEAIQRINDTTTQNIIDYWYDKTPNLVKPVAPTMGKLILARHTESEWNATGQWSGITDVHLSEKGFHEASLLGRAFAALDINIDKAYCSQQIRTLETLEGILNASNQLDVPIERSAAINERDYGDYTGKNKWEIRDFIGELEFNRVRRGWDVPVPNGETLKQVYARVLPFYKEHILPELRAGHNILVVGHGNSMRSLMKYIEKLSDTDIESLEMLFGELVVYAVDDAGQMTARQTAQIDSPVPAQA